MKKHGREERRKNQTKGSVIGSDTELQTKEREAVRHIEAGVYIGLLLTAVLFFVKLGVEQWPVCQLLEESVYDLLQFRLSSRLDAKTLQVIVVDITEMKMDRNSRDRKYDFTNRCDLQDLIQKLAAEQPLGIGLDTDFTPYANQPSGTGLDTNCTPYASQRVQDLQFLQFCLALKRPLVKKPLGPGQDFLVHVGLHETVALGPDLCLADPRFGVLAAFIGFPNVDENESHKRIVEYLTIRYEDEATNKTWRCPSLAVAVTQRDVKPPSRVIAWATQTVTLKQNPDYDVTEFAIDYSPLKALEDNTVLLHDLDSYLHKNYFRDKYVLIGRGKLSRDTGDKYPIPGRPGNSHAGVYVHACAAYTLLRGPLFELNRLGRSLLDIILTLFVIFVVAWIRYHYRREAERVAHERLLSFVTLLAVLVAIGVGFFMVNVTRLMWDDFLLVAASLLVHRSLESKTEGLTAWLVHALPGAWRSLVIRRPAGSARD
jgi:CHASE2 domain-containing sensor protein